MRQSNVARVFNILQDINQRQAIQLSDLAILEERFILTFKPPNPVKRNKDRRSSNEYRLRYTEKKAQRVYLKILEDYPHLFLPFILGFPPKACESFNIEIFRQQYNPNVGISVKNSTEDLLNGIAKKYGFNQNTLFRRLIGSLFAESRIGKPVTGAEEDDYWAYSAADLNALHNILSEAVCVLIEKSPRRIQESKSRMFQGTTECVTMKLPRQNYQDAIISLEVCMDEESETFFKSIFEPSMWEFARNNVSFLLKNASASPIAKIGSRIEDAVGESQLRAWEERYSSHTTDCLSMEINKQACYGILHLRVGFIAGTRIASQLYA